jgi:flagellar FliJ protein
MPDFRFHTLLNYRERIVEDRQIELAEAQRALVAAIAELERLQQERRRYNEGLQRLIQGLLRIDEIEHHYRYLASLDQQIEAQRGQVAAAESAVEEVRARLEDALKDRKTLEKLQEYDEQSFQAAQRQHEANALDDLNIVRYSRS